MIARAPGKLVLSGAYAVLEGAPAIVAAVDRYAVADSSRPADFVTPEVRAALGEAPIPWFDASDLREGDRKLGLGSSAAILVASIAAVDGKPESAADEQWLRRLFDRALIAHRTAQGGGSGVDVAAAVYGGVLAVRRSGETLAIERVTLPKIHLEVWACTVPASTARLVRQVHAFRDGNPEAYGTIMSPLRDAADAAYAAVRSGDGSALIAAMGRQSALLDRLGRASGAPIFMDDVRRLADRAREENCVILPAGAGGGDVTLLVGEQAPSAALASALTEANARLDVQLGAPGVHVTDHLVKPIVTS